MRSVAAPPTYRTPRTWRRRPGALSWRCRTPGARVDELLQVGGHRAEHRGDFEAVSPASEAREMNFTPSAPTPADRTATPAIPTLATRVRALMPTRRTPIPPAAVREVGRPDRRHGRGTATRHERQRYRAGTPVDPAIAGVQRFPLRATVNPNAPKGYVSLVDSGGCRGQREGCLDRLVADVRRRRATYREV